MKHEYPKIGCSFYIFKVLFFPYVGFIQIIFCGLFICPENRNRVYLKLLVKRIYYIQLGAIFGFRE